MQARFLYQLVIALHKVTNIIKHRNLSIALKNFTVLIDGLQPIPRDSVDKGIATMLVEQTKEVLEKSFVYVHQHGGDDVT